MTATSPENRSENRKEINFSRTSHSWRLTRRDRRQGAATPPRPNQRIPVDARSMVRFVAIFGANLRLPFLDSQGLVSATVVEHRRALEGDVGDALRQPTLDGFRGRRSVAGYRAGGHNYVRDTGTDLIAFQPFNPLPQ
jgi:hypothetical protein